jgi:Kef-type K+ transport system membrane component KefB
MIVSLVAPDGEEQRALVHKLEGVGYGFFIPVFFVVSGMRFDLTALLATPATLMRVPLFLALFLVVRGVPALLYRRDLPASELPPLGLLSATQLPVVITTIAVAAGRMRPENAAALVGAGMLSVFVFPLLALGMIRRYRG